MSYLDNNGITYFYKKIKEKFIRSVTAGQNTLIPDSTGNIVITNVPTADNLTSPDGQTSYGVYAYRTSGGSADLKSGPAELLYIDGNVEIIGREDENILINTTNNIQVDINLNIWRQAASTSGNYIFNYSADTQEWSPSLLTYGLTVSNIIESSATVSISGAIESASIVLADWETQITTSGNYLFIYNNNNWQLNNQNVILDTYGITITGTPENGDIITVEYIAATPDSEIIISYSKKEQGTINIATPSTFEATGFNQFNPNNVISNLGVSPEGVAVNEENSYLCYCKAVGNVNNGYIAYSSNEHINTIAWSSKIPQEGDLLELVEQINGQAMASIQFNDNGYVIVAVDTSEDLCVHPQWSGIMNNVYESYVQPSIITLPTRGWLDATMSGPQYTLPLGTYGIPAIGDVADRLNLDNGIYIQKIGKYDYSSSNLELVKNMGVPYDYDDSKILYVQSVPSTYFVNVNPNYVVNDWGTEEFTNTIVPVKAQTLYDQNLRDKLRNNVLTISAQTLESNEKNQIYENLSLCPVKIGSVSLPSNNWSDSAPYSQTITIPNVTITSDLKVDLQPNATVFSYLEAQGISALFVENNLGILTAYSIGAKPTQDLTVQCTYYKVI